MRADEAFPRYCPLLQLSFLCELRTVEWCEWRESYRGPLLLLAPVAGRGCRGVAAADAAGVVWKDSNGASADGAAADSAHGTDGPAATVGCGLWFSGAADADLYGGLAVVYRGDGGLSSGTAGRAVEGDGDGGHG